MVEKLAWEGGLWGLRNAIRETGAVDQKNVDQIVEHVIMAVERKWVSMPYHRRNAALDCYLSFRTLYSMMRMSGFMVAQAVGELAGPHLDPDPRGNIELLREIVLQCFFSAGKLMQDKHLIMSHKKAAYFEHKEAVIFTIMKTDKEINNGYKGFTKQPDTAGIIDTMENELSNAMLSIDDTMNIWEVIEGYITICIEITYNFFEKTKYNAAKYRVAKKMTEGAALLCLTPNEYEAMAIIHAKRIANDHLKLLSNNADVTHKGNGTIN